MANYNYNRDIPNGPNNPSDDQPLMQVNTNSIDTLISEDHYSFNVNNGGFHKQVRMPQIGAIPTMIASSGGLYVKNANAQSQLFYSNGTSGNEYQMTRVDNTDFATFSTGGLATKGWSFLPGGLLIQWGQTDNVQTDTAITFPNQFSTAPYSITINAFGNTNSRIFTFVKTSSTSQFTVAIRDSSGSNITADVYWMAIGR